MAPDDDEPQPAGYGLPAIFTNRYFIRVDGDIVRFVFSDAVIGKKARDHTHVVMTLTNAEELAELLGQLVKKAKT